MIDHLFFFSSAVYSVEKIGRLHLIFFYFPTILFTAALVCDIVNYYFNKPIALAIGHWMIIGAVVMCIPTIISGLAAASGMNPDDPILAKHTSLGYSTGVFGSLYAGLRIAAMNWPLNLKATHYIGLSVLMVALISWTSDYGALVSQGIELPLNVKNSTQTREAAKE
jgi:uncharacterized membrane protein